MAGYNSWSYAQQKPTYSASNKKNNPATGSSSTKVEPYNSWYYAQDHKTSSGTTGGNYTQTGQTSGSYQGDGYDGYQGDYYDEQQQIYDDYLADLEAAAAAQRRAERERQKAAYNASVQNVNAQTNDALQQAYIQNQLALRDLPQQASLQGLGGLSESALIQTNADYGNNRAAIEKQRLASIADLEAQLNQGLYASEGDYQAQLQNILAAQKDARLEQLAQRAYQTTAGRAVANTNIATKAQEYAAPTANNITTVKDIYQGYGQPNSAWQYAATGSGNKNRTLEEMALSGVLTGSRYNR